jgi:hypothetical protein
MRLALEDQGEWCLFDVSRSSGRIEEAMQWAAGFGQQVLDRPHEQVDT